MTAPQIARHVAIRARTARLRRAWTQQEAAVRAGMSLSSLRRFERSGEIAFLSLVRLSVALGAVQGVTALFPDQPVSMDEVAKTIIEEVAESVAGWPERAESAGVSRAGMERISRHLGG